MAKEKPVSSLFFTELDAILDTRMGTLLQIDPDCVQRVIENGYFTRDRDLFFEIDSKQFQERYKTRDKKTLQASVMTPMLSYIKDFCKHTYEGNIKTPYLKQPIVRVNTYPYQLSDKEKALLLNAIKFRLGNIPPVEFVHLTYEQITPSYLKQDTSIIALYDPFEWLEVHSKNERLRKETCPLVMMIGPLMFRNLEIRDKDIREFQTHMEFLSKPFVDLQLMHSKIFSADVLPRKNKKTTVEDKKETA